MFAPRFAAPYIDTHAEAQHWEVERNDAGAIIDLYDPPIRCATPAVMMQELRATFRDETRPS